MKYLYLPLLLVTFSGSCFGAENNGESPPSYEAQWPENKETENISIIYDNTSDNFTVNMKPDYTAPLTIHAEGEKLPLHENNLYFVSNEEMQVTVVTEDSSTQKVNLSKNKLTKIELPKIGIREIIASCYSGKNFKQSKTFAPSLTFSDSRVCLLNYYFKVAAVLENGAKLVTQGIEMEITKIAEDLTINTQQSLAK